MTPEGEGIMANVTKPVFIVMVDRYENADITGQVLDQSTGYLCDFHSLVKLPAIMDKLCDKYKLPQKTHQLRGFSYSDSRKDIDGGDDKMAEEKVPEKGAKATFLVTIRYRQNATFQGSIKWLEANEERNFRSELEMIKLIDDAVIDENADDAKW